MRRARRQVVDMNARRFYQMRLAAVPDQGECSVLELPPRQQKQVDELVAPLLTDRQWQAIDEHQTKVQAALLTDRADDHLRL